MYGPSTVKQIMEEKHVRRGEVARIITLEALFDIYQEAFHQHNDKTHANLKQKANMLRRSEGESMRRREKKDCEREQ